MDQNTASEKTAKRLAACISGYTEQVKPFRVIEGLGGGFRFCTLGEALFDEFGDIAPAVSFPDLAAHVFFAETGAPIPARADSGSSLIGLHDKKAVYLLFEPAVQGVPREAAGNVLTPDAVSHLPKPPEGFTGQRIVFAEGCTVSSERLKAEALIFKQIPYQIEGI